MCRPSFSSQVCTKLYSQSDTFCLSPIQIASQGFHQGLVLYGVLLNPVRCGNLIGAWPAFAARIQFIPDCNSDVHLIVQTLQKIELPNGSQVGQR